MFDAVVSDLSDRYGLGDRSPELFGLLVGYIFNDRRGGFGGFVEGFREQGHGDTVTSWLGNPRNGRPLNAGDVGTVFGQGLLNDWSGRLGTSRATLSAAIAGVLPRIVGELTPNGRLPGNVAPARTYEPVPADAHVAGKVESSVVDIPVPIMSATAPQSSSLRSPNSVPKTPPSRAEEMAAAIASPATNPTAGFAADPYADRHQRHRSPPYKQGRLGGLAWLIVIALIAGVGYYAWWSGQLDPWLRQSGLMPR